MIYRSIPLMFLALIPWIIARGQVNAEKAEQAQEIFHEGIQKGLEGEFQAAIEHFSRAIEMKPLFAEAFLYRGIALSELKRFPEAIKDFSISLELNPELADQGLYFRGLARSAAGDHELAIDDYSKALNINPDYLTYYQRGKSCFAIGRYEAAVQDFSIALRIRPRFADAVLYRAKAYYHSGEGLLALEDLNQASILLSGSAEVHYYRGLVNRVLQNEAAAKEDFDIALRLNPHISIPGNENKASSYQPAPPVPEAAPQPEKAPASQGRRMPGQLTAGYYNHLFSPIDRMQGFGVQVTSLTGTGNLEDLMKTYQQKYQQPVYLLIQAEGNQNLYKIIIGQTTQRRQAEALRDELRSSGFPDCFIVSF